jgi:hypothetical protein
MTVNVSKPAINVREKLAELDKPTGIAGEAMLRAETPQEQFNLIGAGRRNLLINGGMQISQRGDFSSAVSVTHDAYRIDRFMTLSSPVTSNFQHINVTVDGIAKKAMRIVATSSGSGIIGFNQRIERANVPIGSILTVSCKVRTNHPQVGYRTNSFRGFSGDGPTKVPNDGNWHTLTWTFDSTGTTSNSPDILLVAYNAGDVSISAGDYIEVTDMQLEVGKVATPFEHRSYGEELALCQRYYYKHQRGAHSAYLGIAHCQSSTTAELVYFHPVPMRATPQMDSSATIRVKTADGTSGTSQNTTAITFDDPEQFAVSLGLTVTSGLVAGNAATVWLTGSADYIEGDAEL